MVGLSPHLWRSLANLVCVAQNCGLHYIQCHHFLLASPVKLYDPGATRSRPIPLLFAQRSQHGGRRGESVLRVAGTFLVAFAVPGQADSHSARRQVLKAAGGIAYTLQAGAGT